MVRDPSSEHTVEGYREMTPEADLGPAHTHKHKDIYEHWSIYEHAHTSMHTHRHSKNKCKKKWLCASALHDEALGLITRVRDKLLNGLN